MRFSRCSISKAELRQQLSRQNITQSLRLFTFLTSTMLLNGIVEPTAVGGCSGIGGSFSLMFLPLGSNLG